MENKKKVIPFGFGYNEEEAFNGELTFIDDELKKNDEINEKQSEESFTGAEVDKENNKIKFTNSKGEEVASIDTSDIAPSATVIKDVTYDSARQVLVITFDNDETIEVDMNDLINAEELEEEIATKADASALTEVAESVEGKADSTAVTEMQETISEMQSAFDEIQSAFTEVQSSLEDAESQISANTSAVEALNTKDEELEGKIDSKAEQADFEALSGNVYTKEEVDNLIPKDFATKEELAAETSARTEADGSLTTAIEGKADKSELDDLATKAELQAVQEQIPDVSEKVDWVESTPGRKHIVLKNHDSILGTATNNETYNLAMVSKWDVADFGSSTLHANLNSKDGVVTINDNKQIATKDELPDVSEYAKMSDVTAAIETAVAPLAVKADVESELEGKADNAYVDAAVSGKADSDSVYTKSEIDTELEGKADASVVTELTTVVDGKADTNDVYTKAEVDGLIPDVSGFAVQSAVTEAIDAETSARTDADAALQDAIDAIVIPDISGKVDKEINGANGKALIFNESDGGGAKFEHSDGTWSFAGVNDGGENGLAGQIYALKKNAEDKFEGARIDITKDGMYYTVGAASLNDRIDDVNQIAVQGNINSAVTTATADMATQTWVNNQGFLTQHQSLADYATKTDVSDAIADLVGGAPSTLDTLKEIADALTSEESSITTIAAAIETKANAADVYTKGEIDNKIGDLGEIVEEEAQEATYWQEGDDLPDGVSVGDIKTTAVAAVTRERSVKEYVDESVQTVNEKPEVADLQEKVAALENALKRVDANVYQTMMNDLEVLDTLKEANSVTISEGTIADIVIPETTKSKTINAELDENSTLTLNSRYSVTVNNSGSATTNLDVTAPAVEGYNAATITLNGGEYDTVTVTDASLTVQSGATIQNVVITEETTKALTINAMFEDGATVTSNSSAPITLTNKNGAGEAVSVTLDAPGSTVTLTGGQWVSMNAAVSDNTLIINKAAHIQNLNVTQGNVLVKVARQSDIASVVENYTLETGCTIDYLKDDITNDNQSKLNTMGEHTIIEDIAHSGNFSVGTFSSDNIVWKLNNHSVTMTNTRGIAGFRIRANATLEVDGPGAFVAPEDYGIWLGSSNATATSVVVNGGDFKAATHVLYAEKGVIEVNGGSFMMANPDECDKDPNGNFRFLLNCLDANYKNGTANIVVKGGKFYDFDPGNCYAEGAGTSFLADGYQSVESTEVIEGVTHKVYTVLPIN